MAEAAAHNEKATTNDNGSLQNASATVSKAGEKGSLPKIPVSESVAEKPAGPPTPPDGGSKAWLQVFGGFSLALNTWGLVNFLGILHSLSNHSTSYLYPFGHLWDRFDPGLPVALWWDLLRTSSRRRLLLSRGFPWGVSGRVWHMMTSISTKYWQNFLCQGICVGLGKGCLFTPSIAIIGTYFSTKRSLATGLAAIGSSVDGVIYPIMIKNLINSIGFPWAVRVMAFVMLAGIALALALLRPRLSPRKPGPLFLSAAVREPGYSSFILGLLLASLAFFIPLLHAQTYALNIGMNEDLAFYL